MKHPNRSALERLVSFSWAGVILMALALSNYSLFVVGHHYGLPYILAAVLSVPYDGAALVCADISLKYAREHGANGAGPRLAVTILAGLSAWLNSEHASILHDGLPAHVMYAVPPVVALVLFEFHTRYERRDALKAAGRLAEPRPVLGSYIWSFHPLAASVALWKLAKERLTSRVAVELAQVSARTAIEQARADSALALELAEAQVSPATLLSGVTSKADAVRIAASYVGSDPADVFKWLSKYQSFLPGSLRGFTPAYVRLCLSRDDARQDESQLNDSGYAELSAEDIRAIGSGSNGHGTPSPGEPASREDASDTVIFGGAHAGDRILLGCGCIVTADRTYRIGDDAHCTKHGAQPYANNLRYLARAK